MKNQRMKWLCGCAAGCLLATTGLAQNTAPVTTTTRDHTVVASEKPGKSTQFCSSKDLVGANVKDSQGNKLGDISEIYLNPHNGVVLAAIDISGKRHALVPVQALTLNRQGGLLRNAEVSLNKTKAELESGPVIANNDWEQLDDMAFTKNVYTHYNLQMPSAMGASETPGGVTTGTSTTHDRR